MTVSKHRTASRAAGTAALFACAALPALAALAAPRRPLPERLTPGTASLPGASAPTPRHPDASTPRRPSAGKPLRYNRDIRPVLSDNCFPCHGPDKNKRVSGFRLDVREEALGRGVIVPGKPEQSRLIARIYADQEARLMPPPSAHKSLTPQQKALLRRWVAEGAKYEAHWAYIPPVMAEVPKLNDPRFPVLNPVDAFVRAKLKEKGILPSREAHRRTLLRRVYLDLIGIPPTPADVQAFLADTSPGAYEKVVDRLLASPHFGERMAVPWLDVVRYADTVGFHGDQNQNAWPYRDYVIDSFNRNKPFDQFTVEQLAGDLLLKEQAPPRQAAAKVPPAASKLQPPTSNFQPSASNFQPSTSNFQPPIYWLPIDRQDALAATCFTRLTMMTREGGAQPREYLAKYAADRVRTVGMAWLGATFACAECHDHKYDPITQKDFYSLGAFFADLKQWGVYADYSYTPNPDLKGYNNDYPFPPETKVESRYLKERIARRRARIAQLAAEAGSDSGFDGWRQQAGEFLQKHSGGWETPEPDAQLGAATPVVRTMVRKRKRAATAPGPPAETQLELEEHDDRSVSLRGKGAADLRLRMRPATPWLAAVRLELLPDRGSVARPGMEAAMLTLTAAVGREGEKARPISFRHAGANLSDPRYRSGFEIVGVQGGWKLCSAHPGLPHVSVWLPAAPLRITPGDDLTITLPNVPAARVRISVSPFVPDDPDHAALPAGLKEALDHPDGADARTLALREYLMGAAWKPDAFAKAKELEADVFACRGGMTPVMIYDAKADPMVMRVLPRGNWQDESGAIVTPNVPHFLAGYQPDPGRRLTRLDLAKWIVSPENPLTARVFVNRLWKQFFGNGLSLQAEDLGAQGEWPTHPELLDWLAVRFAKGSGQGSGFRVQGSGVRGQGSGASGPGLTHYALRAATPWNVKDLVKLLVMSATYRQSSSLRPELRTVDPLNRLLASQNPRRLEAEFVRDNALSIAGLLNEDPGGPPCKPYQPAGYYANIQFPDRDYIPDPDDRQWRRGVYMHWQRTFLHPMLANFDAPSREDCIAARIVANTPQQALTLLNDPEFVEAARVFAERLMKGGGDDAARIDAAYQRALARPARPNEKQSLLAFLERVRAAYRRRPEDAKKLLGIGFAPKPEVRDPSEAAVWTTLCRVVLNLQETITRY